MKAEISSLITKPLTLRRFFNHIHRVAAKAGIVLEIDWDDFKRWGGQIHDCFTDRELGYKFKLISEYEDGSCFFYYLDEKI